MQRMASRLAAMPLALVPALLAALVLSGCQGTLGLEPALTAEAPAATEDAEEQETAEGKRHIGKPYQVNGRWFHPKEDEDYEETGIASWYGAEFHGSRTANGERFDPSMLTGAHPTLPLPSFVRVTNLKNGKAAVVRINDRGPFKRGRIIDVSQAAADKLEFRRAGSTKVHVEYLGPAPLGGGDAETLVAEAKYGTGTSAKDERGGIGRFLPSFGLGGSDDEETEGGEVEVRLASAEPARGGGLPGVRAPTAVVSAPQPAPSAVASVAAPETTASAYQAPEEDGIDALIAVSGDAEEASAPAADETAMAEPASATPAAIAPAPAPEPLRAAAPEEAETRIMGAHDLFAAIDSSSGGAGELNGIKPAE